MAGAAPWEPSRRPSPGTWQHPRTQHRRLRALPQPPGLQLTPAAPSQQPGSRLPACLTRNRPLDPESAEQMPQHNPQPPASAGLHPSFSELSSPKTPAPRLAAATATWSAENSPARAQTSFFASLCATGWQVAQGDSPLSRAAGSAPPAFQFHQTQKGRGKRRETTRC